MVISQGLAGVLAAGLLGLSVRSALVPRAAAQAYGVPVGDGVPTPYLEVKANRDLVLAGMLVVAACAGRSALTWALFVGTIAPLADAWIVKRHGKASDTAVHLGTAAFMVAAGCLAASGH